MSTTTVAEAIATLLQTEWSLGAPLAPANIHFDVGWVDPKWIGFSTTSPQIIVTGPITSEIRFFQQEAAGHHLLSYGIYYVNTWLRIAAGSDGDTEEDYAESMRREVVRILNERGCTVTTPTGVSYIKPLDYGRALHELDQTPRVLRFEITCFANYQA